MTDVELCAAVLSARVYTSVAAMPRVACRYTDPTLPVVDRTARRAYAMP